MYILTLNCGSSSVKYSVMDTGSREFIAKGIVERVGIGKSFIMHRHGDMHVKIERDCQDHVAAIKLIIEMLTGREHGVLRDMSEIRAVGHRVVHGGESFKKSALVTEKMMETIRSVASLAPLHNPPNIAGIEAAEKLMPGVPHVAIFDTAFHETMPDYAYMYALPFEWYEKYGIRRYGFHGTSHLYVARRAAVLLGRKPGQANLITLHIGNGASVAAVKKGVSVDTSMGFTPLEGLVMGTRCGDIDPAIPLFVMQKENVQPQDMEKTLNKKSGILGITGRFTDRRDVEAGMEAGDGKCALATEIEAYHIKKYIGAYAAAMGGVDAIVFTAGVGENSAMIRAKALEGLEFLGIKLDKKTNEITRGGREEVEISAKDSQVKVFVIPTNEELVMVEDTLAIVEGKQKAEYSFESR